MQTLPRHQEMIAVVMPTYNEAETIRSTLSEASEKIGNDGNRVVFMVSEDGSTDGTGQALLSLAKTMPNLKVSTCPLRKGYPRAARDAILKAGDGADYILFMDSDGQYDPADFHALWSNLKSSSSDIVMGLRTKRVESPLRIFLSTGLRLMERAFFHVKCRDVTSAFRLMKGETAVSIAGAVQYSKYNFWLEFTALSYLRGYSTKEVPVVYRARQGKSRVYTGRKIVSAAVNEFITLARVWRDFHLRKGNGQRGQSLSY